MIDCAGVLGERGNRFQQLLAMPERELELLEVQLFEVGQDFPIDIVLGEEPRVLREVKSH